MINYLLVFLFSGQDVQLTIVFLLCLSLCSVLHYYLPFYINLDTFGIPNYYKK